MDVAPAALAALREAQALAIERQVGDQFFRVGVIDGGADRHAQGDVFAGGAIAIRAAAVFAVAREVLLGKAVVDQRVDVAISDRPHAAATPAVAAVRAAERDEFLAAHRGATVAAITSDHFNPGFVDELHGGLRPCDVRTAGKKRIGATSAIANKTRLE